MNHSTEDFDAALAAFEQAYTDLVNAEHTRRGWTADVHRFMFEHETGPKYVRVVQQRTGGGMGRSVYAFVRRSDGAILYPAGWRGPVTKPHGVRGSIYAEDHGISCCGPFGMKTLR